MIEVMMYKILKAHPQSALHFLKVKAVTKRSTHVANPAKAAPALLVGHPANRIDSGLDTSFNNNFTSGHASSKRRQYGARCAAKRAPATKAARMTQVLKSSSGKRQVEGWPALVLLPAAISETMVDMRTQAACDDA
jgi:hypothetical protein